MSGNPGSIHPVIPPVSPSNVQTYHSVLAAETFAPNNLWTHSSFPKWLLHPDLFQRCSEDTLSLVLPRSQYSTLQKSLLLSGSSYIASHHLTSSEVTSVFPFQLHLHSLHIKTHCVPQVPGGCLSICVCAHLSLVPLSHSHPTHAPRMRSSWFLS